MIEDTASSTDHQEDPIKLLVVEDDPAMLIAFQDVLKGAGFEVLSASNGEAALELLGHTKPALILSDISMPIMDGYEFLKQVKSNTDLKKVPFLFLTARASSEMIVEGLEEGADDYIVKPFNSLELLEIGINGANASELLSLQVGDVIRVAAPGSNKSPGMLF